MLGRAIDSNSVILVAVTVCRAVLVISSALAVQCTAFQEAVDAVKSGRLSVRQAAEHYSCARSTLSSHARDSVRHRGPGMNPLLCQNWKRRLLFAPALLWAPLVIHQIVI